MSPKFKNFQTAIISLSSLFILFLILAFPQRSFSAAFNGLNTWLKVVFPALLPFFIASDIMIGLGIVDFLSTLLQPIMRPIFRCPGNSSFVWVMSITSGYPMGAKLIASLYKKGDITKIEAQRMLSFCSTSGPLFMIGAVGVGMLGSQEAGKIIAISHYTSAIILGFLFRFYGARYEKSPLKISTSKPILSTALDNLFIARHKDGRPLGEIMGDAVKNSMQAQFLVGGFIILFSVLIELFFQKGSAQNMISSTDSLSSLTLNLSHKIAAGILEITSGCKLISTTGIPIFYKLASIGFLVGWGGFSIHSQVASLLSKTDLSMSLYLLSKLCHGVLSALITSIITIYIYHGDTPVFAPSPQLQHIPWEKMLLASMGLLLSSVFLLLSMALSALCIRLVKRQL